MLKAAYQISTGTKGNVGVAIAATEEALLRARRVAAREHAIANLAARRFRAGYWLLNTASQDVTEQLVHDLAQLEGIHLYVRNGKPV